MTDGQNAKIVNETPFPTDIFGRCLRRRRSQVTAIHPLDVCAIAEPSRSHEQHGGAGGGLRRGDAGHGQRPVLQESGAFHRLLARQQPSREPCWPRRPSGSSTPTGAWARASATTRRPANTCGRPASSARKST
eukprot:scaffold62_cov256-Pinguiococcus_pyrenoidosus.AAC.33